jgi:hypothetical protein
MYIYIYLLIDVDLYRWIQAFKLPTTLHELFIYVLHMKKGNTS